MEKYIVLFIGIFTIVSCDNFLAENPESQATVEQYFNNPEDAKSIVNSIYRTGVPTFYNGSFAGSNVMMGGYMAGFFDNGRKGERPGPIEAQNLNLNPVNLNSYLAEWWTKPYDAIARANTAIENIPKINGLTDNETNLLIAEARFFRAFNYFYLVKNFGAVPRIIEPQDGTDNLAKNRDDIEEIYDLITKDLNWAIEQGGLAKVPFPMNDFRITEGAVASLLADVYLQMAGFPLQEIDNYAQAANAAKIVINAGEHELIKHGTTVEESAYNKMRTSDVRREYIYSYEYDGVNQANDNPQYTYPANVNPEGVIYGNTWNGYRPTKEFMQVYNFRLDLRAQNKQFFFNEINRDEVLYELGEWSIYRFHDDQAIFETGTGKQDVKIYRYAEILLIAAEAIARTDGVTDEAVSYLTDVRNRAYWKTDKRDIESSLVGLSEEEFVEEVWKERLRELPVEYKIWSDIQRTRMYPEISDSDDLGNVDFVDVIGHSNNWGETYQEKDLLYPIPNNIMQRNDSLKQNPGY